ncbi:MAG: CRISPR-associated helicase Cas3' [Ruminococcus sp.]|nr:CRISPR-associated helicase Cas3' [Ruminococcus sp.]
MNANSKLLQSLIDSGIYPAHIRFDDGKPVIQTNTNHCETVGEIARKILEGVGLGNTGYSAGRIHDGGKYTDESRKYLVDAVEGRPVSRGSVNHTFAGVRYVLNKWHGDSEDPMTKLTAEYVAFVAGSHHGMFDMVDRDGKNGFEHRLTKDVPYIQKAVEGLDSEFSLDMDECMKEATKEITAVYSRFLDKGEEENLPFYESLLSRLILSAVIEGDRRDTAEFMSNTKFPELSPPMKETWDACLERLEGQIGEFKNYTLINQARSYISQQCKDFSPHGSGIYRLNVPTGAGKTLSSLRFALSHASIHNKKRIFYVIPLLAVIEQNAKAIRDAVGNDDLILEHHSNIIPDDGKTDGELSQREFLMQTWNSPIVITTLVQFLNTLFSDKTSCIRRFHSLCNSVIIIDEVQTVPGKLLSLFNRAITFIAEACNATVVLCSATQPTLESAKRPLTLSPQEIVTHNSELWKAFERTRIVNIGTMSIEEIATFGEELLCEKDSLLIVCNKRSEAEKLFGFMNVPGVQKFHYSASMCIAQRQDALKAMEEAKKHGKVLCVSTQAIEAGVDISFQGEIRFQAGMDSIVQAAGRCNRNGESDTIETVYVVKCKGETLGFLKDIENGKKATDSIFTKYPNNPSSDEAIREYYRVFYNIYRDNAQDGACEVDGKSTSLYEMLSSNADFLKEDAIYFLNQAQKTAGEYFKVFDDDTTDVVVPYGEGKKLIEELFKCSADDWEQIKSLTQKLRPYTISLYGYERSNLEKNGALMRTNCGILVLSDGWYDEKALGLLSEPKADNFMK